MSFSDKRKLIMMSNASDFNFAVIDLGAILSYRLLVVPQRAYTRIGSSRIIILCRSNEAVAGCLS